MTASTEICTGAIFTIWWAFQLCVLRMYPLIRYNTTLLHLSDLAFFCTNLQKHCHVLEVFAQVRLDCGAWCGRSDCAEKAKELGRNDGECGIIIMHVLIPSFTFIIIILHDNTPANILDILNNIIMLNSRLGQTRRNTLAGVSPTSISWTTWPRIIPGQIFTRMFPLDCT